MPHPVLVVTLNTKELERKILDQELIAIGRDMDNDIVINNLAVSRFHAIVQVKDSKVFVKDMASANGTFVNGQRVEEYELKNGDLILIGKYILRLETQSNANKPETTSAKEMDDGTVIFDSQTRDKFIEKLHSEKEQKYPLLIIDDGKEIPIKNNYITIGKRQDADININGWFINDHHAIIQKQDDGNFKIVNMGSFIKPTKVNGKVIKEKLLQKGDVIQIGNYRIIFS